MSTSFDGLISKVKECGQKTVSVAVAQDSAVLEAVRAAKDRGIANAILVGDEEKIKATAAAGGIDISDFEIINEPDEWTAALTAVKLAHDGKVDMYMKGLLETKTFLKSILDKEVGLRTGNPLSHVCVFDIPGIDQEHIRILLPHHPDKSSPLSHSPHTIHRQNATVTIIGIQEYDLILPVILINIQS